MKTLLYFILFAFCSQLNYAQKNGPYVKHFDNGQIKVEGQYKNKKRVGEWKDYHKNGKLARVYSYKDGKRNKEYKKYFEDGTLEGETININGTYIAKGYFKSGKLEYERKHKNGYYKNYLEDGTLKVSANRIDYELSGIWTQYYDTGEKKWIVTYIDGYREGPYKGFYKNGQIMVEGSMIKDKKDGTEKMFSDTGEQIKNKSELKLIIIPDGNIEKVPIFPGCENYLNNKTRKNCMSKMVQMFIATKFNSNIANNKGLSGKQKINVVFKIDKAGNVIGVRARGPHPDLEKEAVRVIQSLPKFTPGIQRGKPVIVPYSLPITFQAKKDNKTTKKRKLPN